MRQTNSSANVSLACFRHKAMDTCHHLLLFMLTEWLLTIRSQSLLGANIRISFGVFGSISTCSDKCSPIAMQMDPYGPSIPYFVFVTEHHL